MILATVWMLRASPGPIAGAPLKSPMVSVTWPKPLAVVQIPVAVVAGGIGAAGAQTPPTEPTPDARLMRFKRLKKSARSWTLTRSVIGMFLIDERVKVQLRADFFNLLNRINLASGVGSVGGVCAPAAVTGICTTNSGFGQVTDTIVDFNGAAAIGPGEARNIQLVAKIIF